MPVDRPLWQPSDDRIRRSHMFQFLTRCSARHHFNPDWNSLRDWSVARPADFWSEMLDYAEIRLSRAADAPMSGHGMLGTKWFPGARLNYARHLLRFNDEQPAIIFENELGQSRSLTRRQLNDAVARLAAAFRRDGLRPGDRVAAFMPNVPETLIAMLATTSMGAVWSSCSPDFGVAGVLDRFGQIEPTVLVACDGYTYGGKPIDATARVADMAARLPSLRRVVVVPYLAECRTAPARSVELAASISGAMSPAGRAIVSLWGDFLDSAGAPPALHFEEVAFDHPLFIMYSSGTTGVPKCIVHGHGGTLIQHMKELMLHTDLRRDDRILYFTTCGWMMWNWLVSALGVGAAVVLYEGNPAHPDIGHLWNLSERVGLHVLGASPKFIAACEKSDAHPGRDHDLSALRCVCSTGSPLAVEQFEWIYARVKSELQLASICGGTDIISCFMLGNPILPVYAGEIQCRGLGMDVQAWSDAGRPVVGEKGELVCCSPFPSQPIGFWNDADGSKYRSAYFDHDWTGRPAVEGPVWRHGDFVEITPRGGVIVYGRSDATLNPGGVRIGTSEIYRVVESFPEVLDSIVVGRDTPDHDVEIVLFLMLRPGHALTAELETRIRSAIATHCTKRHVPRTIRQVSDIPRTISGKKVELAVRQVLHGQPVKNRDALANPEALDQFRP